MEELVQVVDLRAAEADLIIEDLHGRSHRLVLEGHLDPRVVGVAQYVVELVDVDAVGGVGHNVEEIAPPVGRPVPPTLGALSVGDLRAATSLGT